MPYKINLCKNDSLKKILHKRWKKKQKDKKGKEMKNKSIKSYLDK